MEEKIRRNIKIKDRKADKPVEDNSNKKDSKDSKDSKNNIRKNNQSIKAGRSIHVDNRRDESAAKMNLNLNNNHSRKKNEAGSPKYKFNKGENPEKSGEKYKDNNIGKKADIRSTGRATEHRRQTTENRKPENYKEGLKPQKQAYNRERASLKKGACPYLRDCGGCNILQQSYEAELKEKQKLVDDLIKGYCRVETIIGMKQPQHYRNKVHVVFDHDRKGNPISGVYEERTHHVVPVETCLIHNQKADEIIATIRGMLKSFKIKTYDEDTGFGLLRHVMIRTGYTSGEVMVVLVLSSPIFPSKNNFVKALKTAHPEITTIVLNVNDKATSMVLGEKEHVIYGKGYIEDSLCGKIFRISAKSFYQVNPVQTAVLYGKAIELAGLTGTETIIDAYCGIGTIGIIASDHAKKVIGVELNKDAVRDAIINAKRNNASNIDFYNNDAGDFITEMAAENATADVIFMDPPRTGSSEKFLDAAAALKAKKIIYVSCNPVTLERDLQYLANKGYRAVKAQPVDMFPWTEHVETCCLLYKVR